MDRNRNNTCNTPVVVSYYSMHLVIRVDYTMMAISTRRGTRGSHFQISSVSVHLVPGSKCNQRIKHEITR